ncbi:MAG: 16S rRNA (guanine(966)-N(2))-methyltransferase RsmD, partial [Clostridiales bacterium]|nr:16S rRNA (guanine(966)-N(2))-methyltransferase RsmD [Clostridiales bacterium]
VISGSKKGLKLKAPKGLSTRPTTDRIKESLFNILSPVLRECRFLDMFAGSGGIGIEALSRGASEVFFIDRDREALKVIKDNIQKADFSRQAVVLGFDWKTALKHIENRGLKFDVIFMDPPYNSDFIENILDEIKNLGILNNEGIVVVKQAKDEPKIIKEGFKVYRVKDYGKTTKISFLTLEETENVKSGLPGEL